MTLSTGQEILLGWLTSGLANAITSSILNPLDIIKTRMQINAQLSSTISIQMNTIQKSMIQPSFYQVFMKIYQEGGIIGLWTPGLIPTIYREILNSGPRAGLYVPVRNYFSSVLVSTSSTNVNIGSDNSSLLCKILAALCTGTIGAILSNPIDVIKVRSMIQPQLYPNTLVAIKTIYANENIGGFYKGLMPSALRAAFIAVGELATYDHAKFTLKQYFLISPKEENIYLHIVASLITGLVAATVAAPFDVLKTRLMNTSGNNHNISMVSTLHNIIKYEGITTLLRGWLPSYLRLGPHALICFPIFEKFRYIVGLDYI